MPAKWLALLLFTPVRSGTQFWLGRPAGFALKRFLAKHSSLGPNEALLPEITQPLGADRKLPKGLHARSMQRSISGDFDAAAAAVLAWGSREASTNVKCFVARDTASKQMATCAQTYIPQVWCVNPVFQTYSVAQRLTRRHKVRSDWAALPFGATRIAAVAYTTQQGHLLAGEERLSVAQGPDGTLHIQVLSVSKGAGLRGRLVYPFIGPMQQSFFREQLDVVSEAAARKL